MEPKIYVLEKFQEHLHDGFQSFCNLHGIVQTQDEFLKYLIDQNLIAMPHLQRYTVIHEYEKIRAEEQYPKTLAVDRISNRFRISTRTVWSILRKAKTSK